MGVSVSGIKKHNEETRQGVSQCGKGTSISDMCVDKDFTEESTRYKDKTESSVNNSSEEYFKYSCNPCDTAGDHVEAQGYCTNCEEYLCDNCFKAHSRGKATKNHGLQDKDSMPRRNVKACEPCKTAGEEIDAIGYCCNCDEYLCSNCFISHSRSKATKYHDLKDQDNMPLQSNMILKSSVTKSNMHKQGAGYQKYNEVQSYIWDINVKGSNDEKDCVVIAMTFVSNTELVLADSSNNSLKIVDVERNVIKGTMDLESVPFSLTRISKKSVAVALFEVNQIQIINLSRDMSVKRTIEVTGLGLDIQYVNERIYVSFEMPVSFQILQPSGTVDKKINPDSKVLKHCTCPRDIAVSPDERSIYVSDCNTKNVMCLDIHGNMISMYQGELKLPNAIAISPLGSVYLCDRDQHTVYKMTSDLSEATVVLDFHSPYVLCLCAEKQYMCISSGIASDFIEVFKWH